MKPSDWSKWEFEGYAGRRFRTMCFRRGRVRESWFGVLRTETEYRNVPEEIGSKVALAALNGDLIRVGDSVRWADQVLDEAKKERDRAFDAERQCAVANHNLAKRIIEQEIALAAACQPKGKGRAKRR